MKRARPLSLVEYTSDEEIWDEPVLIDESDPDSWTGVRGATAAPKRFRKLPQLLPSFILPTPASDPSRHQGRTRTTPHVDGQYAAHIYVPVVTTLATQFAASGSTFHRLVQDVVQDAKTIVPQINSDWLSMSPALLEDAPPLKSPELHVSLSRPIYLLRDQLEELKRAVKQVATAHKPFMASFASFATFDNDEGTRTFLGMEIGAGHTELQSLSESLSPTLRLLHQRTFYTEPHFHASFAWALLDQMRSHLQPGTHPNIELIASFPSIEAFPSSLLEQITAKYGSRLWKLGVFEVNEIRLKIAKEELSWSLSG